MDLRKMTPPSLPVGRGTAAPPTLSSSASMISPLNPLPSPWSENAGSQPSMAGEIYSPSGPSGAIRLTRVPTSVRLAADLIKSASQTPPLQLVDTPSSTSSVPTPNPSPAEDESSTGGDNRKIALGPSASLPPGALSSSLSQRWKDSVSSSPSPPDHRAPPASLSPSLSISSDLPSTSTAPISVPQGHNRTRSSHHEGYWSPTSFRTSPGSAGAHSSVTEESYSAYGSYSPGINAVPIPSRLRSVSQKGGLAMDLAGVSSAIGDAASHASMIMQSRQAKVQRWRPGNYNTIVSACRIPIGVLIIAGRSTTAQQDGQSCRCSLPAQCVFRRTAATAHLSMD